MNDDKNEGSILIDVIVWGGMLFCMYHAFLGLTTKAVLAFGGRGTGAYTYVAYEDHPIMFLFYLGFYLLITIGGMRAIVRWLRR